MSHSNTSIHGRYARKLPGKALSLCESVMRLRTTEAPREWLDQARREAHKLKGTAGAYGFMGVSQCADRIEQALGVTDGLAERVDGIDWGGMCNALRELTEAATLGSRG